MNSLLPLEKIYKDLPPEDQKVVEGVARLLLEKYTVETSNDSTEKKANPLKGLGRDLNIHLTQKEIDEARREMWSGFGHKEF